MFLYINVNHWFYLLDNCSVWTCVPSLEGTHHHTITQSHPHQQNLIIIPTKQLCTTTITTRPLYLAYRLQGFHKLNPSAAVVTIKPGICGWKCNSLMSFCPWWQNNICGGMSSTPSIVWCPASSLSSSKLMSHTMHVWSLELVASTLSSVQLHSMLVTGARWNWKWATGLSFSNLRKSQILKPPSSLPLANKKPTNGFQLITRTETNKQTRTQNQKNRKQSQYWPTLPPPAPNRMTFTWSHWRLACEHLQWPTSTELCDARQRYEHCNRRSNSQTLCPQHVPTQQKRQT